jgi:hypothetical protein
VKAQCHSCGRVTDTEKIAAPLLDDLAAWQARVVPRGSWQLAFEENG